MNLVVFLALNFRKFLKNRNGNHNIYARNVYAPGTVSLGGAKWARLTLI